MGVRVRLLIGLFFLPGLLYAQQIRYTISGTVVEKGTGKPLAGTHITFQNFVIGTSTDEEGEFEFSANLKPGNYTLRISFLGFRQKQHPIKLDSEREINLGTIPLETDIIGAEEVVITGASALTSKKQLGNAISTINLEELEHSGASSIDRALSGKIAGALVQQNSGNPAGGISVRLRGTGTLLGSADPLYIVDGVIINNDSPVLVTLGGYAQNRLVDLNPEDIERIEVVKGAAAAALYGSRANNGVVQIFTKKGTAGDPDITYSTSFQINKVRNTLETNMAKNERGLFLDNDGSLLIDKIDPMTNDTAFGRRYDFQDFIFRPGLGTQQYLSAGGGHTGTRYFISGSYFGNEGIIDATDFQRATGRINIDQELTQWASLSAGASYARSFSKEKPNGGLNDNYGVLTGFIFGPNTFDPRPDPKTGVYPSGTVLVNPVEAIDTYDVNQTINRIIAHAGLSLTPFPGLSADYTLGLDTYNQTATFFIPAGTTAPGLGSGFARRAERDNLQINNDLNIRYRQMITGDIESTSLLGGTLQYEQFSTVRLEARQFSPFIEVVSGGANFEQPGESRGEQAIYGMFGQQTFGYKDKLFITAAGRFDASSSFGESERWQFYPKISGSYLISEEDFWKHAGLSGNIPTLKLRASLGESGGLTAIGPFARFTTFSPGSVNGKSALTPSSARGAVDVRPERQRELELGVDASFLNDRMALEFTWYSQQTKDLLLTRSLAPSSGFLSRLGNFGNLHNRGMELLVKGLPVDNGHVQWTGTVTFSKNSNKAEGIENDILILGSSFDQVAAINGRSLGVFYSSYFARNSDGSLLLTPGGLPQRERDGRDAMGQPAGPVAKKVIGDPNPDFNGSFINDIQIGSRWNFRTQFDFVYGNDVFNFTRRLAALSAFGTLQDPFGDELEGKYPSGYSNAVFRIFENWIEDGSYIKLRELSASYTTYPSFMGLESVRFRLIGRNLFSIDRYSGYDPEINTAGQRTAVRGFDFVEVPVPQSVQVGITANF